MLWISSYVIVFEFSWKVKEKKNRRHYLLTDPRIKVKIILEKIFVSVLFTPTRLVAETRAHFPRYIPTTRKKKNPTRACWVCASHKKHTHIYLRGNTWKICYIFVFTLSSYMTCSEKRSLSLYLLALFVNLFFCCFLATPGITTLSLQFKFKRQIQT